MPRTERTTHVANILENMVRWSRVMMRARPAPFPDRLLTSSQQDALFALAHSRGAVTHGGLAAQLGLTAGAVTQLLEPLRRAGLVDQRANPQDARSRVLALTPAATAHIADLESDMIGRLSGEFAGLSDHELATLDTLLARTAGLTRTTGLARTAGR